MTSTIETIDAAFEEGSTVIDLINKGIDDASFKYLLAKEMETVTTLYLGTSLYI